MAQKQNVTQEIVAQNLLGFSPDTSRNDSVWWLSHARGV